ncbi:MAG: amino acid ABC transporter substrate-binding protein [Thalassobaculum sp.]|uniref:amino acid ABC transporter substrate-binding protein n=1 Tax=Thalassobaculum sp. TaxID=2022740 RepID=UPI0032EC30BE
MKKVSLFGLGAGLLAALTFTAEPASAQQSTLDIVKSRGHLRCQVGTPAPGWYVLSDAGKWSGFDVENCRAVSAAIFGDPDKIEYQSVTSAVRFTAMANGESDMLSRTTTWTLFRDTQLGLDFTTVSFYDGQGFMVTKDLGVKSALELKGATVCVATGTTTELNLSDYSRTNGLDMKPVVFEDSNVRDNTFFTGGCDAITNDKSSLASTRAKAPDQSIFTILPETISKEPLGPVVRQNDSQWKDIVLWSVFAMIQAEEFGITSANVDKIAAETTNPEIKRMLGLEGDLNKGLGLDPKWAYNIIKTVGNYGENYEEFMGEKTVMNIPRDGSPNALWTKGGLLYSPPFR